MAQQKKLIFSNISILFKKKKFIFLMHLLFVLLIVFNIFNIVITQKEKYFSFNYNQSFASLHKTYYDSVYKNKHGSFIPDEVIYSYVSGALVRGESPILLNPEVPPLGTYIIGLSTIIFNNQHLIIIIFALLSLFLMFLIGRQVFGSDTLALLPPTLFSFEPIFKNQLVFTPLLDIIQLTFLLSIFYFFNKAIGNKKRFFLLIVIVNIFLGFFISTKFYGTGITVVFAILLPFVIHKEWKRFIYTIVAMPIAVVILYANYFVVILKGYSFIKFLGIQKWIFLYNEGHVMNFFTMWPLLLFNKWYLWYGKVKVISDSQWIISWPILTLTSLIFALISFVRRYLNRNLEILFFWMLSYLLFLSFSNASARYFVILIPVLYITSIYAIIEFVKSDFIRTKVKI